jgi:2-polyprenyl-3-methyl-5-hydroxy-6-metoxy-1,4-benzoquinol methylase
MAAFRKAFIYKRYKEVLKQEDQYWGQVALEKLLEGEVPRWVDTRRHISQYNEFGKESWMELYRVLFHKQLRRILLNVLGLSGPVLELGCGCGWLALELARLGCSGYRCQ